MMEYKYPYKIDINNKNFNMVLFDTVYNYIAHELSDFIIEYDHEGFVRCNGDWCYIRIFDRDNYELKTDYGGCFSVREDNFIIFEEEDRMKAKEIALKLLRYYKRT